MFESDFECSSSPSAMQVGLTQQAEGLKRKDWLSLGKKEFSQQTAYLNFQPANPLAHLRLASTNTAQAGSLKTVCVSASMCVSWSLQSLSRVWLFVIPMNCSLPGSSVHGILQARILEWIAIPFSSRSSWPSDQTVVSCIACRFFTSWVTREVKSDAIKNNIAYEPGMLSP